MNDIKSQIGLGASIAILSLVAPVQANFAQAASPRPVYEHYYIGLDGREFLTSGTYIGLANPNYNRLTFLSPHIEPDPSTNHFHSIGAYSYTGTLDNPIIISTSTNNRLPESYTGLPPINLLPGTGVFADRLISKTIVGQEYTNWTIEPVQSLLEYENDLATQFLFDSSGGRWQQSLGDAEIALELVSITPGLGVANSAGTDLFDSIGDTYVIGQGDNFSFLPTFYTTKSAPKGNYSAEFRLLDVNTANGHTPLALSGTFNIDFQVQAVPEPSTLLGFGLLSSLALISRRKDKTP